MWYRALALSALCLWPATSWAALAIDAVSSSACGACTSLSWSHTVSGSDTLLDVGTSGYDTTPDTITGVTYNAAPMTVVPSSSATNGGHTVAIYGLVAPATGTNTVVVSANGTMTDLGAGAVSFTGAHQTTPFGTANTATGSSTTPSVNVSSAADEIVMDTVNIIHNGTLTVDGSQTQRWNAISGSGFIKYGGSTETGSATTTMSWGNSTSQAWAIAAVPVKPSTGGATTGPPMLRLHLGGGK